MGLLLKGISGRINYFLEFSFFRKSECVSVVKGFDCKKYLSLDGVNKITVVTVKSSEICPLNTFNQNLTSILNTTTNRFPFIFPT